MTAPAPSLRRQLAIGLSAGVLGFWLVALVGAGLIVRHELDEVFDSALQETGERILSLSVIELIDTESNAAAQRVNRVTEHAEFFTYVVRDAAGKPLLRSHDADLSAFPASLAEGFATTATHRIFSRAAVSGNYVISVAEPLRHRRETVVAAISALVAPVLMLVPLSLAGIFWVVGRSLQPVLRLRDEVAARDGADLRPVTATGLPEEVVPIADAVNQLLDRIHRAMDAERSFTANSAHELRTPIAAGLAQTQRLIAETPAGPLRDRARGIETQLRRLARLSEKLMQLARAEGGAVLADAAQDLAPILAFVAGEFGHAAAGRLRLDLPQGGTAPSRMDPDAFGILARNLIENALRHGDPDQPVTVTMTPDGTLRVVNAGPVVPPDRLARLTTRYERGAATTDGSGLGLAIADTIARSAGARLVLHSPATGQDDGFEAVLHPADSRPEKDTR